MQVFKDTVFDGMERQRSFDIMRALTLFREIESSNHIPSFSMNRDVADNMILDRVRRKIGNLSSATPPLLQQLQADAAQLPPPPPTKNMSKRSEKIKLKKKNKKRKHH